MSDDLAKLRLELAEAKQTIDALVRGEVDAVAHGDGATPVLLRTAQEHLQRSERMLRAVFDGALDALLLADDDGRYVDANPAACELFGLPRRELLGRSVAEFAANEQEVPGAWRSFVARGELRGRFILRRPDGTRRLLDYSATANILPGLHLSALRDVTDAVHAEERFRTLLESAPDGMVIADQHGTIVLVNAQAEKMFGYGREELAGRQVELLLPERFRGAHPSHREAYFGNLRVRPMGLAAELYARRKDGTEFPVQISLAPMHDGHEALVTAAVRDITERKRAEDALRRTEEQLRQAHKMEAIGTLAGGVAHDFNNILSVILSYTKLLEEEIPDDEQVREDLAEIGHAAHRARDLTRQLLAFSRQQVLQPRVISLNDVVGGLEKMVRRLVGEDVELALTLAERLGPVRADPGQIEQVILNLVVNARDAMPSGGALRIETANVHLDEAHAAEHLGVHPGRYVLVSVSDTGVGMDAETQSRIFEPFFTTKEKGKGTGLGLATVFGIVQQSGGHVWVGSEVGRGTTFKIHLPRTDHAKDAPASVAPAPLTLRGTETVLLVEDDEQVRALVHTVLRRGGYNVLEAQNAGDALLLCEQFSAGIDLLLTDVVMPRMSGPQLAERLAPLRPDMKVLYMSGYADEAVLRHGIVKPGLGFFQKPVTPDALLQKVREVLRSSDAS